MNWLCYYTCREGETPHRPKLIISHTCPGVNTHHNCRCTTQINYAKKQLKFNQALRALIEQLWPSCDQCHCHWKQATPPHGHLQRDMPHKKAENVSFWTVALKHTVLLFLWVWMALFLITWRDVFLWEGAPLPERHSNKYAMSISGCNRRRKAKIIKTNGGEDRYLVKLRESNTKQTAAALD